MSGSSSASSVRRLLHLLCFLWVKELCICNASHSLTTSHSQSPSHTPHPLHKHCLKDLNRNIEYHLMIYSSLFLFTYALCWSRPVCAIGVYVLGSMWAHSLLHPLHTHYTMCVLPWCSFPNKVCGGKLSV